MNRTKKHVHDFVWMNWPKVSVMVVLHIILRTTRIRFKLFVWYFRFIYAIFIIFKIAWLFRLYSRSASRCKHIYFFLSNSNIWQEVDLFGLVHLFVKKTYEISLTHAKKLRSYVYDKVFNDQLLNVLVINLKKKREKIRFMWKPWFSL